MRCFSSALSRIADLSWYRTVGWRRSSAASRVPAVLPSRFRPRSTRAAASGSAGAARRTAEFTGELKRPPRRRHRCRHRRPRGCRITRPTTTDTPTRALAALPLAHRPCRLRPDHSGRATRGSIAASPRRGAVAAAERPRLGARLPPDPARPRAAAPRGSPTRSASSCISVPGAELFTTLPDHASSAGVFALRPRRLPDRGLVAPSATTSRAKRRPSIAAAAASALRRVVRARFPSASTPIPRRHSRRRSRGAPRCGAPRSLSTAR